MALVHVQQNTIIRAFPDALSFCARILDDLKLNIQLPQGLSDRPVTDISDLTLADSQEFWIGPLLAAGTPESAAVLHKFNLAQRSQLVRAFEDPDAALEWATTKVIAITSDFPRTAAHMEVGRNKGDVLDPYILAATQTLLYDGDQRKAIGATVAHKALMILEGLLGHLHEEVVGRMRGNLKAPEPRGENQELFDAELNPFPGTDIVQPPTEPDIPLRLHQVKAKTGTLNSSGGARLAEQMRLLLMRYRGAEVYSHSLVGSTLSGHRSMGGMLRLEPNLIVTVGETAFRILTGSTIGPELLLRLYQNAFLKAARETGYNIDIMAASITETFKSRAEAEGEGFLELLLHRATRGDPNQQDSRSYMGARNRRD
jgi:hypothetical protein